MSGLAPIIGQLGRRAFNALTTVRAHFIGMSDPVRAMRYIHDRAAFLSYAAGSTKGPRSRWRPKNTSEDDLLKKDWGLITARARDLVRSSGHVSGALTKIVNNVVYLGIKPQAQLRDGTGKLDRKRNRAVESLWKAWATHPRVDIYGKQGLALRHSWTDGEGLLHYYESPGLYREGLVPLGVEMLEADHIDSSVNGMQPTGFNAVRGIEFDAEGFPVAYHIFTEHPGASMTGLRSISLGKSVRVSADRIVHFFRPTRASQSRGVSWLAPIILEMKDFDEYQDSERIAARLTSAFAFFVTSQYPEVGPGLLGGHLPSGAAAPGCTALDGAAIPDFVEPGRIQKLPAGTKIQAEGFERPGSNYEGFSKNTLRGASTGTGLTYENYANDHSDASYASARSGSLEERRGFKVQQEYLVNRLCNPVWRTWCQFLGLTGLADGIVQPGAQIPVTWQTPGWPWVDPQKDANANKLLKDMRATSLRRICADKGDDLDEIMDEIREEQELYGDLLAPAATTKENANAPQEG